jgi:sugar phosphate isomerase/epimerase
MNPSRRQFLVATAGAGAAISLSWPAFTAAKFTSPAIRVGSCMIGLEAAKQAKLEGVQVDLKLVGDDLDVASREKRDDYKKQMHETGLPICALMMGILNSHPLASDSRGPKWLEQAIDAAQDLGATAILVAFFGKGDLLDKAGEVKRDDVDAVVARLKDAAPRAKAAGVVLAIEDYLDANQNLQILDRVGHDSVQIWYDVFNTGGTKGYDVPAEIRLLQGRIAQFHFKNGRQYLGEGKLDFPAIAQAIKDVGYTGWIVLETSSPSGNPIADARRNGEYVRKLFGLTST